MRKALFAAVALLVLMAAPAFGWDADERYEKKYVAQYKATEDACGNDAPGRNIVLSGLGEDFDREAGEKRVREDTIEMESMRVACLAPPEPTVETSTNVAPEEAPVETSAPATSSGGCPSYMAGEASSPDAVNPSSGAAGCYQVIPSTAAAMGSACADVNSSSCVAAICAAQGDDAWVAADPCGYVGGRSEDG